MANKMTYDERIAKASDLSKNGFNKKAIYQLEMAMKLEPSKSEKLKKAIAELENPIGKLDEDKILNPDEVIKFKVLKSFTSDEGHHRKNDIIDWERWRKCYKERVVALEDM